MQVGSGGGFDRTQGLSGGDQQHLQSFPMLTPDHNMRVVRLTEDIDVHMKTASPSINHQGIQPPRDPLGPARFQQALFAPMSESNLQDMSFEYTRENKTLNKPNNPLQGQAATLGPAGLPDDQMAMDIDDDLAPPLLPKNPSDNLTTAGLPADQIAMDVEDDLAPPVHFKEMIAEDAAQQARFLIADRYIHPEAFPDQGASKEIKENYEQTLHPESTTKEVSKGVNKVVIYDIKTDWEYTDKVVGKQTGGADQQARQVHLAGNLGKFFPQANIVDARYSTDRSVLTKPENFIDGLEAVKGLNQSSQKTQHTALLSLTLQMVDLHPDNIGINDKGELVLFDTDLVMYENNNFQLTPARPHDPTPFGNNPLGQNQLQTLNIPIDDQVLENHLNGLHSMVDSEFNSVEVGLSLPHGRVVHDTLVKFLRDDESLSIHTDNNSLSAPTVSINVKEVKQTFIKKLKANPALKHAILDDLRQNGIPEEVVQKFDARPGLMHPKHTSIRQMNALRQREERLTGFKTLRQTLPTPQHTPEHKTALIHQHIMALPCDTETKHQIWMALGSGNPEARDKAIDYVTQMVEQPLTFNTLVRAAYPTTSRLFDAFRGTDLAVGLSWPNAPAYHAILSDEVSKLTGVT